MSEYDHMGHNGLTPEDDAERLRLRNEWSRRGMAEREAKRKRQHEQAREVGGFGLAEALQFVGGLFGKSGEGRDASGRRVVWRNGRAEYAEDEGIPAPGWPRK